jgi:hypothetical protein
MKRLLLTAGAVLVMAAPAFAADVTIEKRTTTTTTTEEPKSGSTVSTVVIAPNPPPPPRAEAPPPPPGPAVVWVGGRWSWEPGARNYVWIPGKYLEPPRAHAAWVPGHWAKRAGGWVFEEGRWD